MENKPLIKTIGKSKPVVGIIALIHGNEKVGLRIQNYWKKKKLKKGTIKLIIANPIAYKKTVRFVDQDLNRSLPGKLDGNIEEQLAYHLTLCLKECDYVIDLHSCTSPTPPFVIVRNNKGRTFKLALKTNLNHIVVLKKTYQNGQSSIDVAQCGIGIELGLHDKEKTFKAGVNAINSVLNSLKMISTQRKANNKPQVFQVMSQLMKPENFIPNKKIKNFAMVKEKDALGQSGTKTIKADRSFYPVLFGEKAYKDLLCWQAEKIS